MKVFNLLKVLRLFVKRCPTKKVVFQTKDGIVHPIVSFCLDPVTDWFSEYSEVNASCLAFNKRFEDYKTFYFIVERKMVKS